MGYERTSEWKFLRVRFLQAVTPYITLTKFPMLPTRTIARDFDRSHVAVMMPALDLNDRGIGLWLDESLENGAHA